MTTRSRSHPLAGLEPPRPPDGLRARALAAGRAARPVLERDMWSRLWSSRPLRLLWAGVVVGLLLAHLVLSLPGHHTVAPAPRVVAAGGADSELTAFLDLEPIEPDALLQVEARAVDTITGRSDHGGGNNGS